MKLTFTRKIALAVLTAALPTAVSAASDYTRTSDGATATAGGSDITLTYYTPSTVRVVKTPAGSKSAGGESLSVSLKPQGVKVKAQEKDGRLTLTSDSLVTQLDLTTGEVTFTDRKGRTLLTEKGTAVFTPADDAGTPTYRVRQDFALEGDEAIYGLGNLENGHLSQRGVKRQLMPGNVEDGIPVYVSAKGYGVYWDNYSPTDFIDGDGTTYFESSVGDRADYYFMRGHNVDGVIGEMRELSGRVPMMPLWSYGFWQSRERYKTQDEIVDVVNRYREREIPLDGIIQDWQYWGNNYLWNAMEFMNADFNRADKMVKDIHDQNAKIIISIWSSFGPATKPYKELDEKGMLFNISTWPQSGISEQWPPRMDYPSGVRVYDAYNPEARDIYWNHLKRLYDYDLDGWWMDSTEPDHLDWKPEDMDTRTHLGSFRKVRGAYPLLTVGGVYDHNRAESDAKRVFILTRSGFFGQQRTGSNVWTGDVSSTWQSLRNQVPALLNFTMTGNPNSNSDIGGFFAGAYNKGFGDNSAVRNPQFQELYVRWMQFGALTPMIRSHGADIKREIYYFGNQGEPVYDALTDAIKLRYALLPYIYSTAHDVTASHSSFMRPLVMDFPADKAGHDRADQYMFGKNILVAPIVDPHYTPEKILNIDENSGWNKEERAGGENGAFAAVDFTAPYQTEVYLPAGTAWWDMETEEKHEGGQTISKSVTLRSLPLFLRAGTILPIGPDVQWATQKPWDDLEVRVYPGANGEFTLYEDEGDNYNYENGAYSTIKMKWNDRSRTLTIEPRKGTFDGMIGSRTFNVTLHDGNVNKTVAVSYDGKKKTVKL